MQCVPARANRRKRRTIHDLLGFTPPPLAHKNGDVANQRISRTTSRSLLELRDLLLQLFNPRCTLRTLELLLVLRINQ